MITFARGREEGEWNLRSTEPLTIGVAVSVTTKAGGTKPATPTRELWSGDDRDGNKVWLYATARREAAQKQPALTTCPHCGKNLNGAPELKVGQDDLPF